MTSVCNQGRPGHKSVATVALVVECVDTVVWDKQRFAIKKLSEEFLEISRSAFLQNVTEDVGYRKLFECWVPVKLIDDRKM